MWSRTCTIWILMLPGVLGGCTSYRSLAWTPEVRRAGIIGKRYVLMQDLPVIKPKGYRFAEFERPEAFYDAFDWRVPSRTPPTGPVVEVRDVVEEQNFETTMHHIIATIQSGPMAGRRVSLSEIASFHSKSGVAADDRFLMPHPWLGLDESRSDELIAMLDSPQIAVRYHAARVLGIPTPMKPEVRRALARHANDPDPDVQTRVLMSLGRGINDDRFVIDVLIEKLGRGENPLVNELLAAIGEPAVPQLRQMLGTMDAGVVFAVADILGDIGPPATSALPEMAAAAARDEVGMVGNAMGRIDARRSVALLVPVVEAPHTRRAGARALEGLTSSPAFDSPSSELDNLVDLLVKHLKTPDPWIQRDLVLALKNLGPRAIRAEPALIAMRERSLDPHVQQAIDWALRSIQQQR